MFASPHTFPELPNSSCRNCLHEVKACSPSCLQGFLQTSSCSSPCPSAYSERCCVPTLRSDGSILGVLPTATLSFLFLFLPSDLFPILCNLSGHPSGLPNMLLVQSQYLLSFQLLSCILDIESTANCRSCHQRTESLHLSLAAQTPRCKRRSKWGVHELAQSLLHSFQLSHSPCVCCVTAPIYIATSCSCD